MKPRWQIKYESLEVTSLLSPMITQVVYVDHSHGKSDELELTVHDTDALWRTGWWPAKTDRLDASIGYEGRALVPCGEFQVDDVNPSGPPDVVKIHALSAGHSEQMRTKRTRAFEATTLDVVLTTIATEQGLTLVGTVATDPIERLTQDDETTLAFLQRLAEDRGYAFNIRGDRLCFVSLTELEAAPPVLTFGRRELMPYDFSHHAQHTYIACEVAYLDPISGRAIKHRAYEANFRVRGSEPVEPPPVEVPETIKYGDKGKPLVGEWQTFLQTQGTGPRGLYDYRVDDWYLDITAGGTAKFQEMNGVPVNGHEVGPETWRAAIALGFRGGPPQAEQPPGDILYIDERVENARDAERKAIEHLRRANRLQAGGKFTVSGTPLLVAGAKIRLEGLYRLSGEYLVETSRHVLSKTGGYTTEAEVTFVS